MEHDYINERHHQVCQLRYITAEQAQATGYGCTCPNGWKGHIKQNRFSGGMVEYGAITALFDDIPASEVGVTSGAQSAFGAARDFIKSMTQNQCELAGCALQRQPYGAGDVHTEKCWFTKRAVLHRDGNR